MALVHRLFLFVLGLLLNLCIATEVQAQSKTFQKVYFKSKYAKREVGYLVFYPANFVASKSEGAIIFLHPGSSSGNNLDKLSREVPNRLIAGSKEFSLFTIAPQLPLDMANRWPEELINEFLDDALKKFNIDQERIYITGFGKGGGGTWDYIVKYPERITAAIPIGGYGNRHAICNAKKIPILSFHGELDKTVPAQASRDMTRSLHACGGKILYIEYPNLGYECWDVTYQNAAIYKWLSTKHKRDSITANQDPVSDFMIDKNLKVYSLPQPLKHIGGIVYTGQNRIFAVNEKGNQPYIIETDTMAHVNKLIKLNKSTNVEWRDISKDNAGNILIGDIGNTRGKRTTFQIYVLPLMEVFGESASIIPEKIDFTLSSESLKISYKWNFEAFFWYNGNYYFFTTLDNKIYLFRILKDEHIAEIISTVNVPASVTTPFEISSADISTDFKTVVLLGDEEIIVLSGFESDNFFGGRSKIVKEGFKSAKSGISFINSDKVLISEKNDNGLYDPHLIILPLTH